MTLEDEIQNLKERVMFLEKHVKSLQFRTKNAEDKRARKILDSLIVLLVNKKLLDIHERDDIFQWDKK